jgi:hypothetical protein
MQLIKPPGDVREIACPSGGPHLTLFFLSIKNSYLFYTKLYIFVTQITHLSVF